MSVQIERLQESKVSLKPSNGARVIQVFLNVDMRNAHEGLRKVASESDIDVDQLTPGQYVAFINAAKNRLKLYASSGIVAYYHKPGVSIDMRTIAEIPRAFLGTGRIDYDAALKTVLEKRLH